MSLADPISRKDKEARCAIGGGTFSANPLTMSAGLATLNFLRKNPGVYSKIDKLGSMARKGLEKTFSEGNIQCKVTGAGSLFLAHFGHEQVRNATDVATSDRSMLTKYHMALMDHDIFFLPNKMGAFSYVHEESDVKKLLTATQEIVSSGILQKKA
jgi:glutamate-1-semialdehyde 2,1-aminomutase